MYLKGLYVCFVYVCVRDREREREGERGREREREQNRVEKAKDDRGRYQNRHK
jgi:hypothetical protein